MFNSVITRASVLFALAVFSVSLAFAQATPAVPFPDQFVSAGGFYNQANSPAASGFVSYAKKLSESGIYSYTVIDITSVSKQPFRAQTTTETGLAQFIKSAGSFDIFTVGTAGAALSGTAAGTNTGFALSGGALVTKAVGAGWFVGASVRATYSTTGTLQYPVGLVVGWGR